MKKVAFLTFGFPSLSESFILRQVKYLQPDVVIARAIDEEEMERQAFYKNLKTFDLIESKGRLYFEKGKQKILGKLLSKPNYQWQNSFNEKLKTILENENIDVLLSQFGPNGIVANQICTALKIKHIVHFHGYDLSSLVLLKKYQNDIISLQNSVSAFVVVNSEMKTKLLQLGIDKSKIVFNPYGIDLKKIRANQAIKKKECTFLFVGRMTAKKDPLGLIKAFEIGTENMLHSRLVLIGGGELSDKVTEAISHSDCTSRIQYLGPLPFEKVKEKLAIADVFVQHSVTDHLGNQEGWPNSIVEAMAFGLPVISTSHAGIKDQIDHGVTGFKVEERDYKTMGAYMRILAEDYDKRVEMGNKGRERIERIGNIEHQMNVLKSLIYDS